MKAQLYDLDGNKKKEVSLPSVFSTPIREDIIAKVMESERISQPYSNYSEAGKRHSAAGTISHKRHDWKGHYGRGIARIPRKTMRRSGTQFVWVGAEISGTRGGRRAHPPHGINKERRINKKEYMLARNGAIASTAHIDYVKKRYERAQNANLHVPIVIESVENVKTKKLFGMIRKLYGDLHEIAFQEKSIRSGVGKRRGRSYKKTRGLLLVTAADEKIFMKGIEVKRLNDLTIADLYPLGRLTMYTEKALEAMSK